MENQSMHFPEFFAAAPRITVRDPLARFLGAAEDGVIEYAYADAVKLAGHSCPTVASAYLMTRAALRALYPDALPERGGIRVELHGERLAGVTGVVANVVSFLTGATEDTGFKGIAGRFDRRGLLFFAVDIPGEIRITRVDTGVAVTVFARLDRVPGDPRIASLMPRCVTGTATADEMALFQSLWQDRVRRLLLECADDPEIIVVQ
jgi:formylmethanofuran dehydrogenase subunit E